VQQLAARSKRQVSWRSAPHSHCLLLVRTLRLTHDFGLANLREAGYEAGIRVIRLDLGCS